MTTRTVNDITTARIRRFLTVEIFGFAMASLVHFGALFPGYEHPKARIAEGVIAAVLLTGLILTLASPSRVRAIGITVQGFALLGTLVGVFTIIIGIGPQSVPDVVFHICIASLLLWGIVTTVRMR